MMLLPIALCLSKDVSYYCCCCVSPVQTLVLYVDFVAVNTVLLLYSSFYDCMFADIWSKLTYIANFKEKP